MLSSLHRATALVVLCTLCTPTFAAAKKAPRKPPLREQITTILADPSVSRAHWGISVTTMDGKPLYGLNDAQYFVPASNNKLFTTAAAIALLGPEETFTTQILTEGTLSNTRTSLVGDLVLKGAGDPNLSGRSFPYLLPSQRPTPAPPEPDPLQHLAKMADNIAASGLKTINGDIIGDDTLFPWEPYPEDWAIDDTVGDDGSPVSALTINDNRIDVTITPSSEGSPAVATFTPLVKYYDLELQVMTGPAKSPTRIAAERDLGSKTVRISGTIAADAKPYVQSLAIHDPAEFAAIAFKRLLEERGITITGTVKARHRLPASPTPQSFLAESHEPLDLVRHTSVVQMPVGKVLATHTSVPVIDDMLWTNKISQNLHAELFLHQLAVAYGTDGSTAEGARVIRTFLTTKAGIDPDDFVLFDGSGLSGHDLLTPRAIVKLLQYASTQPWYEQWKKTLPIGGEDGTLTLRFPAPAMKDRLFAKTGTLSEARGLSGYVVGASGKTVIFSVLVSTHYPRTNADRDAMDKIVNAIAATN